MEKYLANEIESKCSVLYHKDFIRGKPAGFDTRDVYVCELRYSETAKAYSKIKHWSSCLPEAIREQPVDLELFAEPLVITRNVASVYADEAAVTISKKRKASEEPKIEKKRMALGLFIEFIHSQNLPCHTMLNQYRHTMLNQ